MVDVICYSRCFFHVYIHIFGEFYFMCFTRTFILKAFANWKVLINSSLVLFYMKMYITYLTYGTSILFYLILLFKR